MKTACLVEFWFGEKWLEMALIKNIRHDSYCKFILWWTCCCQPFSSVIWFLLQVVWSTSVHVKNLCISVPTDLHVLLSPHVNLWKPYKYIVNMLAAVLLTLHIAIYPEPYRCNITYFKISSIYFLSLLRTQYKYKIQIDDFFCSPHY